MSDGTYSDCGSSFRGDNSVKISFPLPSVFSPLYLNGRYGSLLLGREEYKISFCYIRVDENQTISHGHNLLFVLQVLVLQRELYH